MKITIDLSGLDEFIDEVEEYVNNSMIKAAHDAVNTQKEHNLSSKKTYKITRGTCGMHREPQLFVTGKLSTCMFQQIVRTLRQKIKQKI